MRVLRPIVASVLVSLWVLGGCSGPDAPDQIAFVDTSEAGRGPVESGESGKPPDAQTYGDDLFLDLLWEACEVTGGAACDALWEAAPIGSGYEGFGASCGGRSNQTGCSPSYDGSLPDVLE